MTTLFAANDAVCLKGGNAATSRPAADTRAKPKGYVLPHDIEQRLDGALVTYKNREAAKALAVFLARFWSSRARMARPFPIDRRALADHADLALSEARIRGAIRTLEEVGYLNRGVAPAGSSYKPTPEGLHRKPILFGFGAEYGPLFALANARAERARLRRDGRAVQGVPLGERGRIRPASSRPKAEPSAWRLLHPPAPAVSHAFSPIVNSPKYKDRSGAVVLMGDREGGYRAKSGVDGPAPQSALEAAISRLLEVGRSRRGLA